MAKVSAVKKNEKRKDTIKRYHKKRAELKSVMNNREAAPEDRVAAMIKLSELPRNSSSVRYRNRCALSGRPRAYHGHFGLCRNMLRKMASMGRLPGVKKSSW